MGGEQGQLEEGELLELRRRSCSGGGGGRGRGKEEEETGGVLG